MRRVLICVLLLAFASLLFAGKKESSGRSSGGRLQMLLDKGIYEEAYNYLAGKKSLTRDESATFAFLKLQTDRTRGVRGLALKFKGHYLADFVLLVSYAEGLEVERSREKFGEAAGDLYEHLKRQKSKIAFEQYILAEVAESVGADDLKELLNAACELNISGALNMKGRLMQGAERYKEAAALYKRAADMGMAEACKNISAFLYRGMGAEKNLEQASFYAAKAAEQGDICGMVNLAFLKEQAGELAESKKWIDRAADTHHWMGLLEKGYGLVNGVYGYKVDAKAGFVLVEKSAETGRRAVSFLRLAELYSEGLGVEKNFKMARLFFMCAYKFGDARGGSALIQICKEGGDKDESLYWLLKERKGIGEIAGFETGEILSDKFKKWDAELDALDPYTTDLSGQKLGTAK